MNKNMLRGGLILLLCLLFACTGALAHGNLLLNPGAVQTDGAAEGWTPGAWDMSRSVLETDGGMDGEGGLHIINNTENDARFMQTIAVEPDTVYRFACYVKADCESSGAGANISVENSFAISPAVYDTAGEWVLTEMYGRTGSAQTEITVYARLGGYSATTTGEAWFDDLLVEEVHTVPEGVFVQELEPFTAAAPVQEDEIFIEDEAAADAKGTTALVVVSVLFALGSALCYVYGSKSVRGGLKGAERQGHMRFVLLLAFALAVRLIVGMSVRGFETDINCYLAWSSRLLETGFGGFYAADAFCDYPPGYIYVLGFSGLLRSITGQTGSGALAVLLVKLPNIMADLLACGLLYRFALKKGNAGSAAVLTAMYALNPAVILDSSGWGQTDGLLSLLLVGALILAADKKWIKCLAVFALAMSAKPQALLFAPLGVLVLGAELVRSREKARTAGQMAAGIALALAVWIGLAMPFAHTQTSASMPGAPALVQPVVWLFEKYFGTLGSYSYYTVSACNFWDLIGMNWVAIEDGVAQAIGWMAYAVAFCFALWMYAKSRDSRRLYLIGAAMLTIMFCFGLKMHERYLFPAILLLCFAYNEDRDLRIPFAAIVISCVQLVNMGLVMLYDWTTLAPVWLVKGTDVFALGACGLTVWTCVDLCVRERMIGITRIYRPSAKRLGIQEEQAKKAAGSGLFTAPSFRMELSRREKIVVAAVTALYSVFTFVNLGTLSAPESGWVSSEPGESVVFDLGEEREFTLTYYGGICNSTFSVEFSADGETYSEPAYARYDQGEIFRWLQYRPHNKAEDGTLSALDQHYHTNTARYVRITADEDELILNEIGFLAPDGGLWPVASVTGSGMDDPLKLIDEQQTVPEKPSYYNGTYFDEIYHVRTAYEHLNGLHTYEWTHPPLGKLLIAVGIAIFGMNPFGWRFMGALSGVVMVPLMYLLMRQLSKSRLAAFFAMMLMTLDCMHFTQSRLGTIDCFAVMFIMLMYLFMFRYVRMSFYHEPLKKTLAPLAWCGVSFALGCATKWICIYAGVGLAALFFYSLVRRFMEYNYAETGMRAFTPEEKKIAQRAVRNFWGHAALTCLWCCVFFILVPLLTYYFSYYWQLTPDGDFSVQAVVRLQKSILSYHAGLGADDHYFRSPWYEWPLIVRPMWYYSGNEFMEEGYVSSISCMGNPAVWWGGLVGLIYAAVKFAMSRAKDKKSLYLLIGFASQFMPWVLVPRSTFIYHYFASVPFIILCAAMLIEDIERRNRKLARTVAGAWIGAAGLLCAAFYPLMSGTPMLRSYAKYLRWFNWYNY